MSLMEEFIAEIRFRFQAESIDAAGAHLRKLSMLTGATGFDMESAKVEPAPPRVEGEGGTSYAPLPPDG